MNMGGVVIHMYNKMHADILATLLQYTTYHFMARIMPQNIVVSAYKAWDNIDNMRLVAYNNKILVYYENIIGIKYKYRHVSRGIITQYAEFSYNSWMFYIYQNIKIAYTPLSILIYMDNIFICFTKIDNIIEITRMIDYRPDKIIKRNFIIDENWCRIFTKISARYRDITNSLKKK